LAGEYQFSFSTKIPCIPNFVHCSLNRFLHITTNGPVWVRLKIQFCKLSALGTARHEPIMLYGQPIGKSDVGGFPVRLV
jgi:hypothetical protein